MFFRATSIIATLVEGHYTQICASGAGLSAKFHKHGAPNPMLHPHFTSSTGDFFGFTSLSGTHAHTKLLDVHLCCDVWWRLRAMSTFFGCVGLSDIWYLPSVMSSGCWFGTFCCSIQLGISSSQSTHIFQRGRSTTNQSSDFARFLLFTVSMTFHDLWIPSPQSIKYSPYDPEKWIVSMCSDICTFLFPLGGI